MAKARGKAPNSKKATTGSGRKRVASAAFPAENDRDEFFEGSDDEAPSQGEEDVQPVETADEKRNRIGGSRVLNCYCSIQKQFCLSWIAAS